MLLTELAETITTKLNSSQEKWTSETGVTARTTLDWVTCLSKTSIQVLVVPEMVQYTLDSSLPLRGSKRGTFNQVEALKFVSLMVGKSFESLPTDDDVTPWAESKELLNIRERVTQYLLANPIVFGGKTYGIADVEEIPVDELELDNRNFIAVTQFGYSVGQCGSAPDLLSS